MRRLYLLLALALAACNTPSVPLPPPVVAALGFSDAGGGMVVLQGKPAVQHANARFFALNLSRGDGVITTAAADGSFTTSPFPATDGDSMVLYFERPTGERSEDVCVDMHVGVPLLSLPCR